MRAAADLLADLSQFADHDVPLIEAALALGAMHRPDTDLMTGRDEIHALADDVAAIAGIKPTAAAMAQALTQVLVEQHRFGVGGDGIESHELTDLLRERRGGIDTVAVLWLIVAQTCGFNAEMLSFPLHGLVRLNDHLGGRVIVECADGRVLDTPGLRLLHKLDLGPNAELDPSFFAPLSLRDVVLRWRQSLKMHHLRHGRLDQALALVESALLFSPHRAGLWREAGLMRLRLEDLPGAAAALEQFVQREDNALARGRGQQLLAEIRGRMR